MHDKIIVLIVHLFLTKQNTLKPAHNKGIVHLSQ